MVEAAKLEHTYLIGQTENELYATEWRPQSDLVNSSPSTTDLLCLFFYVYDVFFVWTRDVPDIRFRLAGYPAFIYYPAPVPVEKAVHTMNCLFV